MRGNPQLCLLTANSGVQQELHAAGLGRREKNQQLQEPLFSRNLRLVSTERGSISNCWQYAMQYGAQSGGSSQVVSRPCPYLPPSERGCHARTPMRARRNHLNSRTFYAT